MNILSFPCPHGCGLMISPQPGESDAEALDWHNWMLCAAVPPCGRQWDSALEPGIRRTCTRYVGHPGNCWA